MHNTLLILLIEILVMTKGIIWLFTSHSSHHCIFCLARNMTFFAYIEYQNFTRIHKEEIILQVLIPFQENTLLLSETEYNRTIILAQILFTYYFQSNVDTEILYLLDNFNYRSISEIVSVQAGDFSTLY